MGDFSQVIILAFIPALPWLIGGLAIVGLSRGLLRRRREGDDASLREIHGEMDAIRQELAEVQERLDYSERMLTASRHEAPIQPITRRSLTPV